MTTKVSSDKNMSTLTKTTMGLTIAQQIQDTLTLDAKWRSIGAATPPTSSAGRKALEFDYKYHFKLAGVRWDVKQYLTVTKTTYTYQLLIFKDGTRCSTRSLKALL